MTLTILYSFSFPYGNSLHFLFFFFNDTATTEIYTLSLHDALPIFLRIMPRPLGNDLTLGTVLDTGKPLTLPREARATHRSEEHTSETPVTDQSRMPSSACKKKKCTTHPRNTATLLTLSPLSTLR